MDGGFMSKLPKSHRCRKVGDCFLKAIVRISQKNEDVALMKLGISLGFKFLIILRDIFPHKKQVNVNVCTSLGTSTKTC